MSCATPGATSRRPGATLGYDPQTPVRDGLGPHVGMVSRSHGRKENGVSQTLSATVTRPPGELQALVSIVIPVLNEESIISENLATLAAFFDDCAGAGKWLFIIVDNGSTDSTPQKIQEAIARWPLSRVVNLPEPNYGAALRAGLTTATTPFAFLLDIEQWDLPFLAWAWERRDSYDIFLGSKRSDPTLNFQTSYRRFLSCCLNGLLQALLGFLRHGYARSEIPQPRQSRNTSSRSAGSIAVNSIPSSSCDQSARVSV